MGEKLYPPYLENVSPAFYKTKDGAVIKVPFSMNRTVSLNQIQGMSLTIKSVSTGTVLAESMTTVFDNNIAVFSKVNCSKLRINQFYKFQLAYIGTDGTQGIFSNASIAKCTVEPTLSIMGLSKDKINFIQNAYVGVYTMNKAQQGVNIPSEDVDDNMYDTTERVLTYQFKIYNNYRQLILCTEEAVHNTSEDNMTLKETFDKFKTNFNYDNNQVYYIEYCVKTINGLDLSSGLYRISLRDTIDMKYDLEINAEAYPENGFIALSIKNNGGNVIAGNFVISRRSAPYKKEELVMAQKKRVSYDWSPWEECWTIHMHNTSNYKNRIKDFTIQQGYQYQYSIQQYNKYGIYSNRIVSNICQADFEDMFLYDGAHQLRIKYNPNVSSFKSTVLESKTDTIGSKYPFIFRNGNVKYKEFPIQGLISYLMDGEYTYSTLGNPDDERYYFFNPHDLRDNEKVMGRIRTPSIRTTDFPFQRGTDLDRDNITVEREFKLKVLDWLNDGKPKLFKSPTEGNYIVRLLNVSLTPVQEVGRMLHSFQAQAYEIANYDHENLSKFNLQKDILTDEDVWSIRSTLLWDKNSNDSDFAINTLHRRKTTNLLVADALQLDFHYVTPGTLLKIDNRIVQIGQAGSYHLDAWDDPIKEVLVLSPDYVYGFLDYIYMERATRDTFNHLIKIDAYDAVGRQIDVAGQNILTELEGEETITSDGLQEKNHIQYFTKIVFKLKPVYETNGKNGNVGKLYKYQRKVKRNDWWERHNQKTLSAPTDLTLDHYALFANTDWSNIEEYSTIVTLLYKDGNSIDIDLSEDKYLELDNIGDLLGVYLGSGVYAECSFIGVKYTYEREE